MEAKVAAAARAVARAAAGLAVKEKHLGMKSAMSQQDVREKLRGQPIGGGARIAATGELFFAAALFICRLYCTCHLAAAMRMEHLFALVGSEAKAKGAQSLLPPHCV